jgi:anti-sigma factor RsiW
MMTCREVYGFLDEFLEGALDVSTRQNFEGHLERCLSCRNYLATYRATLATARGSELTDAPAMASAPEDIVRAILASRTAAFVRQPPE